MLSRNNFSAYFFKLFKYSISLENPLISVPVFGISQKVKACVLYRSFPKKSVIAVRNCATRCVERHRIITMYAGIKVDVINNPAFLRLISFSISMFALGEQTN